MLCTDIGTDHIQLIGQWHSDEMFSYLHAQAFPIPRNIAPLMFQTGTFTLIPNSAHANFVQALVLSRAPHQHYLP